MVIDGYNFPNSFIKFGKYDNLVKLKNGSIHMKDFNYYRGKDKQGQGDKFEGSKYINQYVTISVEGIEPFDLPASLYYDPNPDIKIPIFCATWIDSNNSYLQSVDETGIGELHVKLDVERFKADFECDYGLIIDYVEFQYKMETYCKNHNIGLDQGLVNYYDIHNDFDNPWLKNKVNSNDRFYTKDKFFSYQNEVRWVLNKLIDEDKDNLTISVEPFKFCSLLPVEKFSDLVIKRYCFKE